MLTDADRIKLLEKELNAVHRQMHRLMDFSAQILEAIISSEPITNEKAIKMIEKEVVGIPDELNETDDTYRELWMHVRQRFNPPTVEFP